MSNIWTWLFNQATGFIVLAGFCLFLWKQNDRFLEANKTCNQEIIRVYQEQNSRMIDALQKLEIIIKETGPKKKK